jgi:predicted phage terminase large subunit-like protein
MLAEQAIQKIEQPVRSSVEDEGDDVLRIATLDSLVTFAEAFKPKYHAARFHRALAKKLEGCYHRKIRRLCISCAPRHGKSLLTSILFPSWALTKNPRLEIIQASYTAELSESFSQSVKATLASPAYQQIFPPILDPRYNRQKSWATLEGGSYFATGVGGGAVGRGADLLIVDDPIKNRDEANSQTQRDKVWAWFGSTAMTRLSPNGVVIVIATRWHEDDLIGRLTNPEHIRQFKDLGLADETFEVVKLEALCENPDTDLLHRKYGEALWPERWPVKSLEAVRGHIGLQEFHAQYQQRPAPPGGNLVDYRKIKMIERESVPQGLRLVRAWDLALSTSASSDYSCGAFGGIDQAGNVYLVHMSRGKRLWPEQKRVIVQHAEMESNGSFIGIETVAAWKIAQDELREALRGRVTIKGYTPDKDKEARAQPWFTKINDGMFFVVRGTWNQNFFDELEQFPNGSHDDQIDAMTVLWEMTRKRQVLLVA